MKWPEEVVRWLHDNVPGRTTKQVTELIKQQGFEEKYGIIFTEDNIKGAKNRYHIKSGTTPGFPKGRSLKYPPEMRENSHMQCAKDTWQEMTYAAAMMADSLKVMFLTTKASI